MDGSAWEFALVEYFVIYQGVVIEGEIVTEEDDCSGAQGHSRNEVGFLRPHENVVMLGQAEVHVSHRTLLPNR